MGIDLKSLRKKSKLTLKEVSKKMGVTSQRVSQIEKADFLSLDYSNMVKYVEAVGYKLNIQIRNKFTNKKIDL